MRSDDISLNLFSAVFETVPDIAVNLLNRDYTVLWANKIMAANVDRTIDEIMGIPCYKAFRRREEPCPVCLLKIVSETKKACRMERWLDLPGHKRRHGEVRAYPVFDNRGSVTHIFEIILPLDKRKEDEERQKRYIESLEETLRKLNAGAPPDCENAEPDGTEVRLTKREIEVLRLMTQGFSNREISHILRISPDTAKTHVRNIFTKLEVTDRTRAAVWAVSHDLA